MALSMDLTEKVIEIRGLRTRFGRIAGSNASAYATA